MSYCRANPGESDVYVYPTEFENGTVHFVCCGCLMCKPADAEPSHAMPEDWSTNSRAVLFTHLRQHRNKGHLVPQAALDRLMKEMAEEGGS